jgi:putative membrane protein
VSTLDGLPLILVGVSFMLHLLGERRAAILLGRPRSRKARWRAFSFYCGLAAIVVALAPPVDTLAPKLLWVHMLQHVLLLAVAAPLIAHGAPWMSIWRPLPLGLRRSLAKGVARSPACAQLRWIARLLGRPLPAWIAFNASFLAWHLPFAYDLTLRSEAVHALEHMTFVVFGVLMWVQVFDSPPLRSRLRASTRIYYVLAADVVGWLLSLVLAFAGHPLYGAYAHLAHRPGGISALADQQIAGGVMLGPGSLAATLYVFLGLYRWLGQSGEAQAGEPERPHRRQYA